jgi:transcriptional regulator with PAS, ATPase and Fis domain
MTLILDLLDILSENTCPAMTKCPTIPHPMNNTKPPMDRKAIRDRSPYFGKNPLIVELLREIDKVACRKTPILLEGETGTGKSLLARKIHEASKRKGKFVAINCATFSHNLLETELFGHTKGAFTDAKGARKGLVVTAENGTLFLDEIGELPLDFQPKLLHLLEDTAFRPVGADEEQTAVVRIIAATNCDLKQLVKEGTFRADLYYRLNVIPFTAPSLRDRLDDIEGLTQSFMAELCEEHQIDLPLLHKDEIKALKAHQWPGNIRELRNHIERSLLLEIPLHEKIPNQTAQTLNEDNKSLDSHEKKIIQHAITENDGNKSKAALMLGISRRTLDRKLKRWKEIAA